MFLRFVGWSVCLLVELAVGLLMIAVGILLAMMLV